MILISILIFNINCSNAKKENNIFDCCCCCFSKKKKSDENISNIKENIDNTEISSKSVSTDSKVIESKNKLVLHIHSYDAPDEKEKYKLSENKENQNKLGLPRLVLYHSNDNKINNQENRPRSLSLNDKEKIDEQNKNTINSISTSDLKSENIVVVLNGYIND